MVVLRTQSDASLGQACPVQTATNIHRFINPSKKENKTLSPQHNKHAHFKLAATFIALSAVLSACGGGGDAGSGAPDFSAPIAVAPCAAGYQSVTIDNSSVAGAKFSIVVANATFAFSTITGTQPSLQVCMGQPAQALSQTGAYALSETYDLEVTPLNMLSSGVQNLERKLTVQFALSGLPAGTSSADMVNKIRVYSPDASGVWQPMSQSVSHLAIGDPSAVASYLEVTPDHSGKFVVAYKP